jgi:tetratricopeptide (TPR) repeat protein
LVLVWWWSPLAPIGIEKKLSEIKQDTEKIVVLLQEELSGRSAQIVFLQGVVERLQAQAPSPRARDLAAQIPLDADPYALALKAIAESRYVDAVSWYRKALSLRPADPGLLNGMASALMHAGDYVAAEPLYQQALAIQEKALGADHPDMATSLDNLAALYRREGRYAEAEPLSSAKMLSISPHHLLSKQGLRMSDEIE